MPEHDDFLQPAEAAERFGLVPQARLVGVDGAKHLWVGEKYAAPGPERDRGRGHPRAGADGCLGSGRGRCASRQRVGQGR